MVPGDEFAQQDANTPDSSVPEQTSPETPVQESSAEPAKTDTQSDNIPFHEHPRFKELIEERKQHATEMQSYQRQLADMQSRFQEMQKPKEQPKEHPFVAKLAEIDPAYAQYLRDLEAKASQVGEFQQWRQEQERTTLIQKYESSFDKLCGDNKVPAEWKELYKAQVDAMAISNPKLGLNDLPNVFKNVHDRIAKLQRATTAQYVTDKTKAAAAPATQPKGKAAAGRNDKGQFVGDREDVFASIARSATSKARREGEL